MTNTANTATARPLPLVSNPRDSIIYKQRPYVKTIFELRNLKLNSQLEAASFLFGSFFAKLNAEWLLISDSFVFQSNSSR